MLHPREVGREGSKEERSPYELGLGEGLKPPLVLCILPRLALRLCPGGGGGGGRHEERRGEVRWGTSC